MWHQTDREKNTCLQYENGTRRQRVALFSLSWEGALLVTRNRTSTNDCEHATRTEFEVTDKFQQVGKSANIESANNENQLCVCQCVHVSEGMLQEDMNIAKIADRTAERKLALCGYSTYID